MLFGNGIVGVVVSCLVLVVLVVSVVVVVIILKVEFGGYVLEMVWLVSGEVGLLLSCC